METDIINVEILQTSSKMPIYATVGSAAADVCSNEKKNIPAGEVAIVGTGLFMAIPDGYEIQVRSRSGLAAKNGICVLNAPGTIDSDYRGELKIILANFSKQDFTIEVGDRIAQILLNKVIRINWKSVSKLSETTRSTGGFGSTGIKS